MTTNSPVPMLDAAAQYRALKAGMDAAALEVLASGGYILGEAVKRFEQAMAAMLGIEHVIGVANGTDALVLALRALDIGPGDEVITSPFTFIATAEAIRLVGATPVFVDIRRDCFNLDPDLVAAAITPRTRALMPVHLFGQPAELAPLQQLAATHGLRLIEDCAQSIGARYGGAMTGGIGDLGCFSFYPSKNLGACGDGGMVTTRNAELAARLRMLANHGSRVRYTHEAVGYNSRLDALQAALLAVKLPHLPAWNLNRQMIARRYTEALSGLPLTPPVTRPGRDHVFHQYTVLLDDAGVRQPLQDFLKAQGIASMIYYPIPLHRQPVFAAEHADLSLPVAEEVARRCLSLPIYPELAPEPQLRVVEAVHAFFAH